VILQDLSQTRRLQTARRDLVANVSHELRTPLASLKALTETLRDGALDDPPAATRFLDQLNGQVDDLTQIVDELVELTRIESGQVPLRLAPVMVADVVNAVLQRLAPQAERAGLVIASRIPADLPAILADRDRIGQVTTNLLHNAIKFTPRGGRVEVEAAVQASEVVVSVHDTGIGISAESLPRVFERFYKVDRSRTEGGTGLGLAIAKHIVQAHGGRIWVESREGEGSTFSFAVPRADGGD
jgi:two-component system phosphate regulon sensor histidine kinase PhoR